MALDASPCTYSPLNILPLCRIGGSLSVEVQHMGLEEAFLIQVQREWPWGAAWRNEP